MNTIKQNLKEHCIQYVNKRIETIRKEVNSLQSAANEETKSSAGDKYETGRAMMQLEIEKNATQLAEAIKLKQILDNIKDITSHETVRSGSLVITDQGNFYFAISAGTVEIEGKKYLTASLASPIGSRCKGLSKGKAFALNNKLFTIENVY